MRFGVKQSIVNTQAQLDAIVGGYPALTIANKATYLKTATAAGTAGIYTSTVGAGASATGRNTISYEIELASLRQEAEYSRYAWIFGKRIQFGVEVAASASATVIADAIKAVIDKRIARFNDLPFTVASATGVLTITLTEMDITVLDTSINAADKDGKVIIPVTTAVTTPPVSPFGLGSQVEEAVQMLTGKNALAGNMLAEERVDMGATYTKYYWTDDFTTGARPEPAAVGLGAQSGSVELAIWVKTGLDVTALEATV